MLTNEFLFFNDCSLLFYHGYCKYQRDAAVIILRYTTLRHIGLCEVVHFSSVLEHSLEIRGFEV